MLRSLCITERSRSSRRWLLGSSLGLVAASLAILASGAELYSQALLFASFPMALLVSDPRRRRRPGTLIVGLALWYAVMVCVLQLGEKF